MLWPERKHTGADITVPEARSALTLTPALLHNSHHHCGHKTPRDIANIWDRRVSKLGCVGWSCSEASHSE